MSIELFKQKAQLCENQRNKIARIPVSRETSPAGAAAAPPVTNVEGTPVTGASPIGLDNQPGPSKDGFIDLKVKNTLLASSSSQGAGVAAKSKVTSPTRKNCFIYFYILLHMFNLYIIVCTLL